MIPGNIVSYLQNANVPFTRHWHARAVGAQEVAQALHVSGRRLAKTLVVEAAGRRWHVVLPANLQLDEEKLAEGLDSSDVRLVAERDFERDFPGCELGAEPPFGGLYRLPVILDASFSNDARIILRAGSHEETIEVSMTDFVRLESPQVLPVSRPYPRNVRLRSGLGAPI